MKILLTLVVLLFVFFGAQAQQFSHGDPTPDEQYMLELINRARANPGAEGVLVIDTEDGQVQQAYSYFSIDKAATKQAFTTYPQRPPLCFHADLIRAARVHTADMIANNFQGHTSSNGKQLQNRYADVGYSSMGQYGENVAAYSNSVWYGHCGLIVDWGTENQKELGHRSNILNFNSAVYTEIGLGITNSGGGLNQGTVGPVVITQDFGIRSVRYILGVVYNDKNNNGAYDIGEGMTGVEIRNSRNGVFAVSGESGGYAFPMTAGTVTVTASGGGLSSPIVKNITFSSDNVKVDFVPASLSPGVLTLKLPANNATKVDVKNITFTWNPSSFADDYEIEVSTTQTFTSASRIFLQKLGATEYTGSVPDCNTKYYWRVRGINTVGNGNWSTPFSFTTSGTKPSAPSTIGPKGAVAADFDKTITFTFTPVTGATAYHVRVADQPNMAFLMTQDSTLITPELTVPVSSISNSRFYWTVRTKNECGWSAYSSSAEAILTVTSVDEDVVGPGVEGSGLAASINPNPVAMEGAIRLVSPTGQYVTISCYNLSGKLDFQLRQDIPAGVTTLSLPDLNKLVTGTYTIVVQGEMYVVRLRLNRIRD